jgi:hypothetical protein
MRLSFAAALAFATLGCSMFADRAPGYAGHAMDSAANRATDTAIDTATDKARRAAEGGSSENRPNPGEKVTRKLDDDDVLIKQGGDYLVGKALGSQVLVVRTGQKVDAAGQEVVPVKRASKGDLKVGRDAFFTTARGDVRRASWTPGAVTDDGTLGDGTVAVGPEAGLLWEGQVAVKR